ncbi:Uncharacterised protein [Candidatus Norongarragalina meridionalis]|nr:Uncharacterised protein [Candidatus Norongarragalina meridionalis]
MLGVTVRGKRIAFPAGLPDYLRTRGTERKIAGIAEQPVNEVGIKTILLKTGKRWNYYAAIVEAGKAVIPHVHAKGGVEKYYFPEESGVMHIGKATPTSEKAGKLVHLAGWRAPVRAVGTIEVKPGEAHSFHNSTDERILFFFRCHSGHMAEDRFMVVNEPAY